jgi:hypothetical protein
MIAKEACRLQRVYLSGKNDAGQSFDWVEKMNKKGVVAHAAVVGGSTWMAIKATTTFVANLRAILTFYSMTLK